VLAGVIRNLLNVLLALKDQKGGGEEAPAEEAPAAEAPSAEAPASEAPAAEAGPEPEPEQA